MINSKGCQGLASGISYMKALKNLKISIDYNDIGENGA